MIDALIKFAKSYDAAEIMALVLLASVVVAIAWRHS